MYIGSLHKESEDSLDKRVWARVVEHCWKVTRKIRGSLARFVYIDFSQPLHPTSGDENIALPPGTKKAPVTQEF